MFLFVVFVVLALATFAGAVFVSIGAPGAPALAQYADLPWLGILGWLPGLVLLFVGALVARATAKKRRFDLTVAAEFVVVYGIFGLLLNIGAGVLQAQPLLAPSEDDVLSFAMLSPILQRFAEGLAAAGCAPIAAVLLRLIDASSGGGSGAGDTDDLTQAYERLRNAANGAATQITDTGTKFEQTVGVIQRMAGELEAVLMGKEGEQGIATQLASTVATLQGLKEPLDLLQGKASDAANNIASLNVAATNATASLSALQQAIQQVTNFARGGT